MYDLHLHTTNSDGDLPPLRVVEEAVSRGVAGLSLTDHNGVWDVSLVAKRCAELEVSCIQGIEISAIHENVSVHMLGYSREFAVDVLQEGLALLRAGYEDRIRRMCELCQQAGYEQVTFERIAADRAGQVEPVYTGYDVARLLHELHGLPRDKARQLSVQGGPFYVSSGDWILSVADAIKLLHAAGGIAVLGHPGIIAHEEGEEVMHDVITECVREGVDGIEVTHPFGSDELRTSLRATCQEKGLLVTGGSDWHGPERFTDSDLGVFGVTKEEWQVFLDRLSS